jgi:hypothetical protein
MSDSKVVPISIIEKYLDNPGKIASNYEYYNKCVGYNSKGCRDIKEDIRNILTNYDSNDDDDDDDHSDECIPILVIKKYLNNHDYYRYDTTPKVLIKKIKKLLRPEFDCSYCGRTTNCDLSLDCDYYNLHIYSKLTPNEQKEKQIEENHSGFGHIACSDLFCSFNCADKHYEVVHYQEETTNDLRCVNCKSRYNLLSCRCYYKDTINVREYSGEDYRKTIFCKDCINCDKCKPETCNINAVLGTEDVDDHAFRTNYKYEPNGELRKEGEIFVYGAFY